MEPEGSLPHSQVPATYPYLEPAQPIPWPPCHFLNIHRNIFSSTPGFSYLSLPLGFPHQTLYTRTPLLSPILATCSAYPILLHFITQILFREPCRSLSFSFCSFSHSLVTSSPLGPKILLSTLFSNALSLRSFLSVNDLVSHTYKKQEKLYFCIS